MTESSTPTRTAGRARRSKRARQGRELALQTLYEHDLTGHDWRAALDRRAEETRASGEARALAEEWVGGTLACREELDAFISLRAPLWPVGQLAAIDRAILRLGLYELREGSPTPPLAAINEAVELAKAYGGENSGRFVNGLLGARYNERRDTTSLRT